MDETVTHRVEELERRLTVMQRKLARRDGKWVGAAVLVAAIATPVLAWTYTKPHPDFTPGAPISSAQVNETIDDIYEAVNTLDAEVGRVTAQTVIDELGPLPLSGEFQSQGGAVVLFVSGSAWRGSTAGSGMTGANVFVDSTPVGFARTFTNETGSHKALVSNPIIVPDLPAGAHNVELTAIADAATDFNDPFVVVALELPR